MSEPAPATASQAEPNPLEMGCGCLMMFAFAAVVLSIAGASAYWWFTRPNQATVSFSWTLSPRERADRSTVLSGIYMDRMREGDSQLMEFTVRSVNFPSDEARTLLLRLVGPGLVIEPTGGYSLRLSGDVERRLVFSIGANGTGNKTGLIYPQLLEDERPVGTDDQAGTGVPDNFPIRFRVDRQTTFGLTQDSWTVINIITLLFITIVAGVASFMTRAGRWIWTTGWKIYENRDRIDAFLNQPKT